MSSKEIILHFGFHKSATTSIQRTLVANEVLLEMHHWHYPTFEPYAWHNHNVPLLSMFLDNPAEVPVHFYSRRSQSEIREMNKHFRTTFEGIFKKYDRIILSSESAGQLSTGDLIKIKRYLENFGFHLRVLVVVRSPLSYLASWTQERIKKGKYIDKTNLFAQKSSSIRSLNEVFGESVTYFPFNKICLHENGPPGYFLKLLGINDQTEVQFERKNESISKEAAQIINYLNYRGIPAILQHF